MPLGADSLSKEIHRMQPGPAFAAFALAAALAAPPVFAEQNTPAKSGKKQPAKPAAAPKSATDAKAAPAPAKVSEPKRAAVPEPAEPPRVVYTPEKPKPPEGAVQVGPGLWSHLDKDGKTWHYRQTPFGLVKTEPQASPDPAEEELLGVIAHDRGDTVDFERKTPFSVYRWTKKKTDLTRAERNVLERGAKAAGSGSK
jgi:hypothetical protein